MATHAQLDGWHTGRAGAIGTRMAVLTVDLHLSRVVRVAERNRLARPRIVLVPGRIVGPAGLEAGELLVVLGRDLDLEARVERLAALQLLRLADARCALRLLSGRIRPVRRHEQRGDPNRAHDPRGALPPPNQAHGDSDGPLSTCRPTCRRMRSSLRPSWAWGRWAPATRSGVSASNSIGGAERRSNASDRCTEVARFEPRRGQRIGRRPDRLKRVPDAGW